MVSLPRTSTVKNVFFKKIPHDDTHRGHKSFLREKEDILSSKLELTETYAI